MFSIIRERKLQLPEEALDTLRALVDNYERLKSNIARSSDETAPSHAGSDDRISKLRVALDGQPETLWWSDIAQADLCVADLLNGVQLLARIGGWRRRLHEVAGDSRYAAYMLTACDLSSERDEQKLRADLSECIRAVYYFYGAYGVAARSKTIVTRRLLQVAGVILGIEIIIAALLRWHNASLFIFFKPEVRSLLEYALLTSGFSLIGSVVSVQRRLQDPRVEVDPFYRYIQTTADWFGSALVSPLFATALGFLVYALLASKLLSTIVINFDELLLPKAYSDIAVLCVLGFVAGFAEQLIPDALTRLALRAFGASHTKPAVQTAQAGDLG